jgi:hypothetical protein
MTEPRLRRGDRVAHRGQHFRVQDSADTEVALRGAWIGRSSAHFAGEPHGALAALGEPQSMFEFEHAFAQRDGTRGARSGAHS